MRLSFSVAFGTIEPLFAAGSPDGDLGIENVFAGLNIQMAFLWNASPTHHMGGDLRKEAD
jgi:hypothetical protein